MKSLERDGKCMILERELTFIDVVFVVAVSDAPCNSLATLTLSLHQFP